MYRNYCTCASNTTALENRKKILRNGTIQGTDLVPVQTTSAAQLAPLCKSTQKVNFIEINTQKKLFSLLAHRCWARDQRWTPLQE
jgi:hypothetical protein